MEDLPKIKEIITRLKPLIFLDFDGTLAPIVENHEDAAMSDDMQELVMKLAAEYAVAVISGRGLDDVRKRVKLEKIYYGGSHGFEIAGPGGYSSENPEAKKVLPAFEEVEPKLKDKIKNVEGVSFERKKFTLAVHYRKVKDEEEEKVHEAVEEVLTDYPQLKKGEGKKVIEIRPNIYWDKGKAVETLKLKLSDQKDPFIIYIGDDVTDEDVFEFMQNGMGILVGEHGTKTYADYRLESVDEVKDFFRMITEK
jgi:trehalose-phosphatase